MSTALRTYFRGHSLATTRTEPRALTSTYHFDHQGTTQFLTDGAGVPHERHICDAWGNAINDTTGDINRHWYVGNLGYYRDDSLDLHYIRARHLCSLTAQWTCRDPYRLTRKIDAVYPGLLALDRENQTPNTHSHPYCYSSNSPTRLADPSGLRPSVPSCRQLQPKDCFWCIYPMLRDDIRGPGYCPERACNEATRLCNYQKRCYACGLESDPAVYMADLGCWSIDFWFNSGGRGGQYLRFMCGGSGPGFGGADKLAHCYVTCMVRACALGCARPDIDDDTADDVEANHLGWDCGKKHRPFVNYVRHCLSCCQKAVYNLRCT